MPADTHRHAIHKAKCSHICIVDRLYLTQFWMYTCIITIFNNYLNDISIMHYVQFGSNISPHYVMPADTHRHVIHLKNIYLHIICMHRCLSYFG